MKRKIILSILALAILVFIPSHSARADVWGANAMAAILKHTMERIDAEIHGAIMGALKIAAAESINSTVSSLISSGGTSGAMFITDWDDWLVKQPAETTKTYMNDFFTLATKGTSSSGNYVSASGSTEGTTGSYTNYLVEQAKKTTTESTLPQTDLSDYVSDPSEMFSAGNWQGFSSFVSNPANNPFGFTLMSQSVYQEKLDYEKKKAETQAIANKAFKSQTSGGKVITPGSTIADMYINAQDLGNKIIANANSIPEVITAVVTKIATNSIRQGIGTVQQSVQKEVTNVTTSVTSDINEAMQESGPGQLFESMY